MENKWLNLMNLFKKIVILTEKAYHLKNEKIFNELPKEKSYEFQNLKEKINPNNVIYKCKPERRSPKEFNNYQNPIDLFTNFRDGNVRPREVLKKQINFKSDRSRRNKKGTPKSKSEDQISVIQQGLFQKLKEATDRYVKGHFLPKENYKRAPLIRAISMFISFTLLLIKKVFEKKK